MNKPNKIMASVIFVVFLLTMLFSYRLSKINENLTKELDILKINYELLSDEQDTLTNEYMVLETDYETLQEDHDRLRAENAELQAKLEEKPSKDILKIAGELYNVDPKLLESIERLESGHYTSAIYKAKNNTWGAFNGKEYKSFSSHEQSTVELARTLRMNYINQGLDTVEKIAKKYCPDDPSWSDKVRKIYRELS